MVERLRAVLGLDDRVRFGQPRVEVAAILLARPADQRLAANGLLRIEQRLELLPLDLDQLDGGPRPAVRLRRDDCDRPPLVLRLVRQPLDVTGRQDGANAGRLLRPLGVHRPHPRLGAGFRAGPCATFQGRTSAV